MQNKKKNEREFAAVSSWFTLAPNIIILFSLKLKTDKKCDELFFHSISIQKQQPQNMSETPDERNTRNETQIILIDWNDFEKKKHENNNIQNAK